VTCAELTRLHLEIYLAMQDQSLVDAQLGDHFAQSPDFAAHQHLALDSG